MRQVATAIWTHNGRFMLARRTDEKYKGRWEFPGGKVEPGEQPLAAVARELHEELGLRYSSLHSLRILGKAVLKARIDGENQDDPNGLREDTEFVFCLVRTRGRHPVVQFNVHDGCIFMDLEEAERLPAREIMPTHEYALNVIRDNLSPEKLGFKYEKF